MATELSIKLNQILIEKTTKIIPENIKDGITILGIEGTYEGLDTTDATANAGDILATKTAYVNGSKVTGNMVNNGSLSYIPSDNSQSIPAGYTSGGTVSAADITALNDYETCLDIAEDIWDQPYIRLEYIASSGTQYIDTEFSPDQDSRMVLDFQALETEAKVYAGCRASNATTRAFTINSGSGISRPFYFAMDGSGNTNIGSFDLDRHTADLNKTSFKFDNEEKTTPTISDFTANNTVYLFACNNTDNNTVSLQSSCRIYSCKIYDDGQLVRDFIPVKRVSDNVVCMYDTVSETFFTNKGTGTFSAGGEV